jgi:type II secretory pathway pseudopilin PulG
MEKMSEDQEQLEKTKKISLLELLAVIVFVGLLSSFTLIILEDARNKASDASIKEQILQASLQAKVYSLRSDGSYEMFCNDDAISSFVENAYFLSGERLSLKESLCMSRRDGWRIISPLRVDNVFWCADSYGFIGEIGSKDLEVSSLRCNSALSREYDF